MNLYLDDDMIKTSLVARLRRARHHLVLPNEARLAGASDARHFVYCIVNSLTLLTKNRDDFMELHEVVRAAKGNHSGILVQCQAKELGCC